MRKRLKKCRNCSEIFNPVNSLQKYCFKKECVQIWVNEQREKEWKKKKVMVRQQMKTTRDHLKELQKIFNAWVRVRDEGKTCISCNTLLTKELKYDAGHFFPRGSYSNLAFEPMNCHGQCVHCNRDKHGNLHEYREGLIRRYGLSELERLERLKNGSNKLTKDEIIDLKLFYKDLIRKLQQ
jgi:hypothetical protein